MCPASTNDSSPLTSTTPRVRLVTLGGLQLVADGATDIVAGGDPADPTAARWADEVAELNRRRRKLALLVYLVLAPRAVSRDVLIDLFWRDEEPERGRHSLNEALSHLRRVLGRDALGARGGDVRVSAAAPLDADVVDFDRAVRQGASDEVVALYTGPFLDGVFVDRAPRFEMWVASEREQRRRALVTACQSVCTSPLDAQSAERHALAARRWLDASPGSADAARAWIDALAITGTDDAVRSGLEAYEQVARETQLQDEDPLPASFQRLGAALRERVLQSEALTHRAIAGAASRAAGTVTAVPVTVATPTVTRGTRRRWPRVFAGLAVVATAIVATMWIARDRGQARTLASARPYVLLAPVTLTGTTDTTRMADALGVALSSALARYATVDVVPQARVVATLALMQRPDTAALDERTAMEVAERIGASVVLLPDAATLGRSTVLRVRVLSPQGTTIAPLVSRTVASADAFPAAIDTVAADIVQRVAHAGTDIVGAAPLPPATTTSLPALRAYAAGSTAQTRRAWPDAELALRQAVALDSNFSQAWSELGVTYTVLNRPRDAGAAYERALASAAMLAPRERLLVRVKVLREQGRFDDALRDVQGWLLANAGDRAVRRIEAELLRRKGDVAGAARALRDVLAVDSLDPNVWINLAATLIAADTKAANDSAAHAYERAARLDSTVRIDAVFNHQWGAALVRADRADSAVRIFSLMLGRAPALRARGLRSLAHLAIWRQRPGDAVPLLREALQLEERTQASAVTRVRTRMLLAVVHERAGDTALADTQRDSALLRATTRDLQEPLLFYLLGREYARRGHVPRARIVLERLRAVAVPGTARHTAMRQLLQSEIEVADGKWLAATARADSAVALDATTLTMDTQAYAWRRAADASGDPAARQRASEIDQRLAARFEFGWEGTLSSMEARARLAGVRRDARRDVRPAVR